MVMATMNTLTLTTTTTTTMNTTPGPLLHLRRDRVVRGERS
jgi:hypothetical protein